MVNSFNFSIEYEEPAHAGYIGKGMLDAAVLGEIHSIISIYIVHLVDIQLGNVFSSPTVNQVLGAIR